MDKLACCCLGIMVGSEWGGGLEERWCLSFSSLSPPDLTIISLLRADWHWLIGASVSIDLFTQNLSLNPSVLVVGEKTLHFAWIPKPKVLFKG